MPRPVAPVGVGSSVSARPVVPSTPIASPPKPIVAAPQRSGSKAIGLGVAALTVLGLIWLFVWVGPSSGRGSATPTSEPTVVAAAPPKTVVPTAAPTATAAPQPTRVPVSLPNGTDITPPQGPRGLGKLTIKNGTRRDAAAKLVEDTAERTTRRFVYVGANSEVTLEGIAQGTYRLLFMTGVDWDGGARRFLREVSISQFDEPFPFREEPTERGTRFSTWEVTLNPVAGGTGRTSPVPEGAFGQD